MRSDKQKPLKTVEAFEKDIYLQLAFLKHAKFQKPLTESMQKKTVFCGSGDSLAAAMLAEVFSDYRIRALDPLDVVKNKKLLKGKRAYFVSVSGNTISTVRAANLANHSAAITRNQSSRLAKACAGMIKLAYEDSGILTCGSVGFFASMMTCMSLARKTRINARNLFLAAKTQSKKITLRNNVYVLGNQYTYPLAMYAVAKMYEALGANAHYEKIEQFSHMGLFSARRGDTVIIFEEKNMHIEKLARHLKNLGIHTHNPHIGSKSKTDHAVFYTFVSQFVALYNAKRKHLSDCYFVTSKKIRNASSNMIY
ncbi:MAG: sugar isomerase [Candidatus Nitrosotenuis sp.]